MNRVTLIQCTDSKRDAPGAAWYLYDASSYYRDMRSWARARGNPWYILSAKHGLLEPEAMIAEYDAVGISEQQAETIADDLAADGVDIVDVTAGRKYTDHLIPALERRGIDVIDHFAGHGIGKRQQKLQATTELLE